MVWFKSDSSAKIPIKSWCKDIEENTLRQAVNLSNHPMLIHHVALMPDCHTGYGMPIGGVIACKGAIIPNAVGVDIGCGMCSVQTDLPVSRLRDKSITRELLNNIKYRIPAGEGNARSRPQDWSNFEKYLTSIDMSGKEIAPEASHPGWLDQKAWALALHNLGTLGGGNHFIELQKSEDGMLWLMLHSGSRNIGYRIARYYHKQALKLNQKMNVKLPDRELAYLPIDSQEGRDYLRDMQFAMDYASENRRRMMIIYKEEVNAFFKEVRFLKEVNIHHNYTCLESHYRQDVWIHRKGATSAKKDEIGIIPGSMGTPSYIVRGKGNPESFMSCSHGAGRNMSRNAACERLSVEECDKAMQDVVYDGWNKQRYKKRGIVWDVSEAPQAYKKIEDVISAELDLIEPLVKLWPIGVIKG